MSHERTILSVLAIAAVVTVAPLRAQQPGMMGGAHTQQMDQHMARQMAQMQDMMHQMSGMVQRSQQMQQQLNQQTGTG